MSNLNTKHLRALRARATQGEWVHVFSGDIRVDRPHGIPTHVPCMFADYELIVAAVNALPALCDAAEERDRLRGEYRWAVQRAAELEAERDAAVKRAEEAESDARQLRATLDVVEHNAADARAALGQAIADLTAALKGGG